MNSIALHTRNLVPKALVPRMRTTFNVMAENPAVFPDHEEMTAEARQECAALEEVLQQIEAHEVELARLRQLREQVFPRAVQAYQTLSGQVLACAQGNKGVIEGAGFKTRRPRQNLGVVPLPQPEKVLTTRGGDAGQIEVRWPCVAEKTCCEVEINDSLNPNGWRHYDIITKSHCSIRDLPSGKVIWVRLRAIGSKRRKSPWSAPVSVMVA
jgi:hypothetical protein